MKNVANKSLPFTLIIFDVKRESSKNKMAAPDALEGLYVFYRSNRHGFTDSGVGLVRSQIVGGAGAAVVAIQDYDVKLKVPTPTPAYALTAPHRARVYLTAPTAADAWDMIENHEKALVAVRDLSHGHVNDRVCLDGGEYWLKGFSVHGVASLVTFSDPAPFQLPDPILKPPRALKSLTLWVAPVPVAAGHGTTKTHVDVTVRGDSYIDPDGSVKNRGTYLGGKAVPKDDRWLKFASDEAGTTNLTSPLGPQNILVLFDFAYYPALYESASSAQKPARTRSPLGSKPFSLPTSQRSTPRTHTLFCSPHSRTSKACTTSWVSQCATTVPWRRSGTSSPRYGRFSGLGCERRNGGSR